ncbi:hypothetical protein HDU91_002684, partial [Kappamyces sp. JEL0680]
MVELTSLECIGAVSALLFLLFTTTETLWIWRRDKKLRLGYEIVAEDRANADEFEALGESLADHWNWLDSLIAILTFGCLGWFSSFLWLFLTALKEGLKNGPVESIEPSLWVHVLTCVCLALGWLLQLSKVYLAYHPRSTASRYSFYAYGLGLVAPTTMAWSFVLAKDFDSKTAVFSYISLGLVLVLVVLDLVKPVKHAAYLKTVLIQGRNLSAEELASPLDLLSYGWVNHILYKGAKKPLEHEDMPHLVRSDMMQNVVKRWIAFKSPKYSPIWNMLLFTKWNALFQITVAVLTTVLDFSTPFFVNRLLVWIQVKQPDEPIFWGLLLLIGLFIFEMTRMTLYGQINLSSTHWARQIKAAFMYDIFIKSLRRTGGADGDSSTEKGKKASQGKIVSLISADLNQLTWAINDIHYTLVDTPISLIVSISGLWYLLGPSTLAGIAVIVLSGPATTWAMRRLYKNFTVIREFKDK